MERLNHEQTKSARASAERMTYREAQKYLRNLHEEGIALQARKNLIQEEDKKSRHAMLGLLIGGFVACLAVVAVAALLV